MIGLNTRILIPAVALIVGLVVSAALLLGAIPKSIPSETDTASQWIHLTANGLTLLPLMTRYGTLKT